MATARVNVAGDWHVVENMQTFLITLLALLAAAFGAAAQEVDEAPSRVGRVADVNGQLFLAPEDRADEWAPIELNYPIGSGDNLWLSGEGRAEVDFGVGQLRVSGNTNVHVSRLDDHALSLFVAQGQAIVALRALEQGDSARIDTPNTQIELLRPGLYRIDVSDDRQETTVVVREGEANVAAAGGFQQVLQGQTARLAGTTDVQVDVRNGSGLDGFDTWSANRDRYYARVGRSLAYVSNQMVGYADLEQYGTWQTLPDYGAVWFPTAVAVDWAPYRHGHWVSRPAWGWTWVDYAPWGYAPFHYGRWAYVGGRWGWCPGAYVRRPAWAPALVAWYGGNNWGVSVAGGGPVYGWVPLGWRDPYIPSWRNCGSRCWTAYNRPYAVNVAERTRQPTAYVNRGVPGAITAVGGAAFASGNPVAPNVIHVPPNMVATAPVLSAAPMLKPAPVTVNALRPGNGVPPPASTIQARTKPLQVSPPNAVRPMPAPATGAITAAPPSGKPSYNAAEPLQRYARPAPSAVPAAPAAVTSAPPGRVLPQTGQEISRGQPPIAQREGRPPPAPIAQGIPMPRPAPQVVPAAPRPAPQAVPVPPQQVAVPPPRAPAPPRGEHPAPQAIEKPAPGRPQPAAN
ncbi:MAG TPA: DUF6600 domain-containing protein [Casimicrobiaceae bacterium]|jgi:hypothetical protein